MTDDFILREFVCKYCGHKVVVNPELPMDYTPNVCCQCYDQIVKPQSEARRAEMFNGLCKLLSFVAVREDNNEPTGATNGRTTKEGEEDERT